MGTAYQPIQRRVQSAVSSRNPAEPAVALPAVLGSKTVELLATTKLLTSGPTVLMPANRRNQQRRRRPPATRAPYAAPSRNHAKRVVVVAVVLGSETVGVLETKSSVTRGSRVSRSANNGCRPRDPPPPLTKL